MSEKPLRRNAYIDVDSDDSFLDMPQPRYQPDGRPLSDQDVANAGNPEWRKAHGLGPLPEWPDRAARELD